MSKYKYHLQDVDWGEFKISDFFKIQRGNAKNISLKDTKIQNGTVLLSAKDKNNAVNGFVNIENGDIEFKNVLTVNNNGSVGLTYYHPYKFVATSDVTILLPKKKLNGEILLFLTRVIQNNVKLKFAYGYKAANGRLSKSKFLIPINGNGNPNWSFMENYIKEREVEKRKQLIEYYNNKLVESVINPEILNDVEWEEFRIKELFTSKSVKGKPIANYNKGKIPYITTSSINNGVTNFVYSLDDISSPNCISIDPIGGKVFYHNHSFIGRGGAGSAINLLYNENLNLYNGKFICSVVENISKEKASYGTALNGNRLKNMKLILPIDSQGNPNWLYMENFIKNIEQKKLTEVVEYLKQYIYIYKQGI